MYTWLSADDPSPEEVRALAGPFGGLTYRCIIISRDVWISVFTLADSPCHVCQLKWKINGRVVSGLDDHEHALLDFLGFFTLLDLEERRGPRALSAPGEGASPPRVFREIPKNEKIEQERNWIPSC